MFHHALFHVKQCMIFSQLPPFGAPASMLCWKRTGLTTQDFRNRHPSMPPIRPRTLRPRTLRPLTSAPRFGSSLRPLARPLLSPSLRPPLLGASLSPSFIPSLGASLVSSLAPSPQSRRPAPTKTPAPPCQSLRSLLVRPAEEARAEALRAKRGISDKDPEILRNPWVLQSCQATFRSHIPEGKAERMF